MPKRLLICLFVSAYSFSQVENTEVAILGRVLFENKGIEGAHIVNNTASVSTISDAEGNFQLEVALGDLLIVSSINHRIEEVVVSEKIYDERFLRIDLKERVVALQEVVLSQNSTPNFGDISKYEFFPDAQSPVTNYALGQGQGQFYGLQPLKLIELIGKLFSKKKKKERPFSHFRIKPKCSKLVPARFDEDFFAEDLGLAVEDVELFLSYCDYQTYPDDIFQKENEIHLIEFLVNASKEFYKLRNEDE